MNNLEYTWLKVLENNKTCWRDTLVIAHWYWRNWDFYQNAWAEILKRWKYNKVVTFNFPWHDWWKTNISFENSLIYLREILNFAKQETEWEVTLWWHSFWAMISAFLANEEKDIANKLVLSSLPYAMNQQFLSWVWLNTIWLKSHQEIIEMPLFKNKLTKEWHIKFGDLVIPDWEEYAKEFWKIPTTREISRIETDTVLVRARLDLILWIWQLNLSWETIFIWPKHLRNEYKTLDWKFANMKKTIVPFWWHWIKIPETQEKDPSLWKQPVRALIDSIL